MSPVYTLDLNQPPLEESETANKDGLVGTQQWCKILPSYKGHIKMCNMRGSLVSDESTGISSSGGFADGKHFPDISPWKLGIHWTDCRIDFETGTWS